MVYRRRVGRVRRRRVNRRRINRKRTTALVGHKARMYQGIKYFTETFDAGALPQSGGWFICALSSLVNNPQYVQLFDMGTIFRYDVMLVPMKGQVVQGISTPYSGRITVANTQNVGGVSGYFPVIPNEVSLLQESDSKTVPLDGKRIIRFTCYNPKPALSETASATFVNALTVQPNKKWTWLNLNNGQAVNTPFGGIKYWVTGDPLDPPVLPYQVLIRVYAAFKEQD